MPGFQAGLSEETDAASWKKNVKTQLIKLPNRPSRIYAPLHADQVPSPLCDQEAKGLVQRAENLAGIRLSLKLVFV